MGHSEYYEFDDTFSLREGGLVAGTDEAGRGPLAGPVVAASVVLSPESAIKGIMDSKKLSQEKRERLFEEIKNTALGVGVSIVSPERIDELNILNASLSGMREALESLDCDWKVALVDGNRMVPGIENQECIVKGDSRSACIAAASIVAKVTRDRIMREYHFEFPVYGFDRNKGYPTKEHREALYQNGMCVIHRKSFCRNIVAQTELELGI